MINITLGELVVVITLLCLTLAACGWLLDIRRVKRREKAGSRSVILCRICSVRYEVGEEPVTICPSCGTPNEPGSGDVI
jgi:hypothetical protein